MKKNRHLIIGLYLFLPIFLFSQKNFQRLYGEGVGVLVTESENYEIVKVFENQYIRVVVDKETGGKLSENLLGESGSLIIQASSDTYFKVFNLEDSLTEQPYAVVEMISKEGNIVWRKEVRDEEGYLYRGKVNHVIKSKDNHILLNFHLDEAEEDRSILMKINIDGTLIWRKEFTTKTTSLTQAVKDHFYIKYSTRIDGLNFTSTIFKLNNAGEILDTIQANFSGVIQAMRDGGVVLHGRNDTSSTYRMKWDEHGQIVWQGESRLDSAVNYFLWNLRETASGGLIVFRTEIPQGGGGHSFSLSTKTRIYIYDNQGVRLKEDVLEDRCPVRASGPYPIPTYFPISKISIADVVQRSDGGYILVGTLGYCDIFPAHQTLLYTINDFIEPQKVDTEIDIYNLPLFTLYQEDTVNIELVNNGTVAAHNIQVEISIPENVVYTRHFTYAGLYNPNTNFWNIPILHPYEKVELKLFLYPIETFADRIIAEVVGMEEIDFRANSNFFYGSGVEDQTYYLARELDFVTLFPRPLFVNLKTSGLMVEVVDNQLINYSFNLLNTGTKTAWGDFIIKTYLSADEQLDATDIFVDYIAAKDVLPNDYLELAGTFNFPEQFNMADAYVILEVDPFNYLEESNETDNINSVSFQRGMSLQQGLQRQKVIYNRSIEILNLYPSIASNQIEIAIYSELAALPLEIYNAQGEKLFSKVYQDVTGYKTLIVDISNFPTGVYYVLLPTGNRHQPLRFVKMRM